MQRPRSEGLTASPSRHHRHPRQSLQRHQQASNLSKSCEISSFFDVENDIEDEGIEHADQPRRPKTTPKPRVQRMLLGPGQAHVHEARQQSQNSPSTSSFMTHLPDSPPRQLSLRSSLSSLESSTEASRSCITLGCETAVVDPVESLCTIINPQEASDCGDGPSQPALPSLPLQEYPVSDDDEDNSSNCDDLHCSSESSCEEPISNADCDKQERNDDEAETTGPLSLHITETLLPQVSSVNTLHEHDLVRDRTSSDDQSSCSRGEPQTSPTRDGSDTFDFTDSSETSAYEHVQAVRKRLQEEETRRLQMREGLEAYVASLTSRKDENGDKWIEFPKNYQQIVSLMTQQDMREDNSDQGPSGQKPWYHVLIESGLSKQQAYGSLDNSESGNGDSDQGLTAKIALKMARIRQLDAILEDKLGKNLYQQPGSLNQTGKSRVVESNQESGEPNHIKTFVTQPSSLSKDVLITKSRTNSFTPGLPSNSSFARESKAVGAKKNNFIERNKQVVANGMKANLTRDEEARLNMLLEDNDETTNNVVDGTFDALNQNTKRSQHNEFAMDDEDKKSIEELINAKRHAYQSQLLPIDEDILADESGEGAVNIIQITKKERLHKQRLERINQELRFLEETASTPITIISDDDDERSEFDDTTSVMSYRTTTSTSSIRSGVISRREFTQFLCKQTETFAKEKRASTDEIQHLLRSIAPGSATSRTITSAC